MKLTEFGKALRKLRIDNDLSSKDLGKILNVSSTYINSIENGKKAVSDKILNGLVEYFNINKLHYQQLADKQLKEIRIDITTMNNADRNMFLRLFREYPEYSDSKKQSIKDAIEKYEHPLQKCIDSLKTPEGENRIKEYLENENRKESLKQHQIKRILKLFKTSEELERLIKKCIDKDYIKLLQRIFDMGWKNGSDTDDFNQESAFPEDVCEYFGLYFSNTYGQGTVSTIYDTKKEYLWSY